MRFLFAFLFVLVACSPPIDEPVGSAEAPLTMSPGDPLTFLDSGVHFPATGPHLVHTNVVTSGQPTELSIARSTDFPTGNSTLVLGDNYHYYTTVAGQVVTLTTTATASGGPSVWYFLVRGDGIQAAQASKFEIADNLAGGYAWELEPHITGTTSQKYGDRVTQATIDVEKETTTLQVRSGLTTPVILSETTPSIASGETALLVRRNVGGTYALSRVHVADADSCGTGYRCLRIDN
jgi:hypothetical protein